MGSLAYPTVYIPCYRIASANVATYSLTIATLPLLYLVLLYGCLRFMDPPIKGIND